MSHPCQIEAARRLRKLLNVAFSGKATASARIADDLHLDLQGKTQEPTLSFKSEPGTLVGLEGRFANTSCRAALRLEIGGGSLQPGDVLGVMLRTSTGQNAALEVILRAHRGPKISDTRFTDRIALPPREAVVTALHTLEPGDPASGTADRFALVLGLPTHDFRIELHDMHFFVIPAMRGLRSVPARLSSFAA